MQKLLSFNKSKYICFLVSLFFISKLNANDNILMEIKNNILNTENLKFDFTQKTSKLVEKGICIICLLYTSPSPRD